MKSVTVSEAEPYTRQKFQATLTEWDLGAPIGYGNTIQEAIEDFLDRWEMMFEQKLNYKWS